MKKIFLSIISIGVILLLTAGCDDVLNTPTKRVEEFLNDYQTTDNTVLGQLDSTLDSEMALNDTQRNDYRDMMKKQYKDLVYTIKDETVDGDKSTVKVEIEVYDYNKAIKESDSYMLLNQTEFLDEQGTVDNSKFTDYKINKMSEVSDRVKYTIDFSLTKKDNTWKLDDITEVDRQKIHGIYSY